MNNSIQHELDCIIEAMSKPVNKDVPDMVAEKLNNLTNLLALSSKTIADTERRYNEALTAYIHGNKGINITTIKLMFSGDNSDVCYQNTYALQLNKDLHYAIEALRSLLSYLKVEMQASLHSGI
jgi:hypothetical protein